jgi:uncharacterized protein YybS (DUF2232 family)
MKTKDLKKQVIKKLIKGGNNPEDVKKMVDLHFEQASRLYPTLTTICECIRTIY